MDDPQVYLEKISAFSRMLRLNGLSCGPQEVADACKILIEIGFENRELMCQSLCAIYAKSREEQLIFQKVFNSFFISEEAMRQQASEQAQRESEVDSARRESMEDLQLNGEPLNLSEEQRDTYASMPRQERQKLLDFLNRYKSTLCYYIMYINTSAGILRQELGGINYGKKQICRRLSRNRYSSHR